MPGFQGAVQMCVDLGAQIHSSSLSSKQMTTDGCAAGFSLSFLLRPRVADPWTSILIVGNAGDTLEGSPEQYQV